MAGDIQLFEQALQSNLPRDQKSQLRRFVDRMTGGKATEYLEKTGVSIQGDHARAAAHTTRQVVESGAVGVGYGYVDAKLGLDVGKFPIDGAVGLASYFGAIAAGSHEIGHELKNIASSSATVFGYRHMRSFILKKSSAVKITGDSDADMGEDPVLRVARTL
jgi:hypothetical protein